MYITGTITRILDTQQVSDSFQKREVHIKTTDEQYPQDLCIEFHQDKTALLDSFSAGQDVTIGINLRGREWNDPKTGAIRVFNTIAGWKIEPKQ